MLVAAALYVGLGAAPKPPRAAVPIAPAAVAAAPAASPGPAAAPQAEPNPAATPGAAPDGRRPLQAFARPFDRAEKRPRVALVVTGLGQASAVTEAALKLPGAVTLSFSPYAAALADGIERARAAGHEVLLDLPMEPAEYPRDDPGPYTLLTTLDPKANRDRLEAMLGRGNGYVGVVAVKGARFLGAANDLRPVLEAVQRHGLLFIDNGASPQSASVRIAGTIGLPIAAAAPPVDSGDAARAEIDRRLADLEETARRNGAAVGLAGAVPATVERIASWAAGLDERKLALAPVSAVARAVSGEKNEVKE